MNIWRPYVSVKESVNTLDDLTLYRQCIVDISNIMDLFATDLKLKRDDCGHHVLRANEAVTWYWNHGKPFIKDILDFYTFGIAKWKLVGGEDVIFGEQNFTLLSKHELSKNTAPWTEDMARTHRYLLLNNDYFWYKRFFRKEEEYNKKIIFYLPQFMSGQPTELKVTDPTIVSR